MADAVEKHDREPGRSVIPSSVLLLFAHAKLQLGFERLRLRGLSGARDEFHLIATAQNLRRLATLTAAPAPA